MRYRRVFVGGASYFFTVNLAERSSRVLVDRVDALREVVTQVRNRHPFEILAWVVMPIIFMRFGGCPRTTPTTRRGGR